MSNSIKIGQDERTIELINPKALSALNIENSRDVILKDNRKNLSGLNEQTNRLVVKKSKISNARQININNSTKNKLKYKYVNNFIRTARYTWFDFLPKSLLLQFQRYANIYFLMIMTLQCIPMISPLNPITAIGPLILVLLISMIREGMEDLSRHKQDQKENTGKVNKYDTVKGIFETNEAKNLEVGDVIKINEYDIIPADCLLISCSNSNKIAYIETANLDGEKDLKPKNCVPQIHKMFKDADQILRIKGKITVNKPDSDLQKFNGKIELNKNSSYSIGIKQFFYKGTILKNTTWALGIVLYTGKETKIVLNSQKGASKQSHLEKFVNQIIGIIFLFQIALCLILAGLNTLWFRQNPESDVYLKISLDKYIKNQTISGLVSFFSYLLLVNTMIPISLIVTIEMVKYFQAKFMNVDTDMYSFVKHKFVKCNSCSLNEELGQVKYIFSDKTGTLTANKLEFKVSVIGEEVFGMKFDEFNEKQPDEMSLVSDQLSKIKRRVTHQIGGLGMKLDFSFPSDEIKEYIVKGKLGRLYNDIILKSKNGKSSLKLSSSRDVINHYLSCLSLNQTIIVEKTLKPGKQEKKSIIQRPRKSRLSIVSGSFGSPVRNNHSQDIQRVESLESIKLQENFDDYHVSYKGSNPDEIIFVDFARHMGYIYVGGDETVSNLKILKNKSGFAQIYDDQKFEILKIMEFNSTRGMMSVVLRQENANKDSDIILYSKGGDKKIKELLASDQPFLESVSDKASKLSELGLRVLWIAMKVIDKAEFNEWNKDFEEGLKQLVDEDAILQYRIKKYRLIEEGLTLIGCTAVEDKLQDKVPETIKELQTAGVNVWILTGDNLPTAKNIGLMSNLLPSNMDIYEINDDLKKFKEKVLQTVGCLESEKIFNKSVIDESKKMIIKYEENLGIRQFSDITSKIADEESTEDYKKAIIYIGLQEMLHKYKISEVENPGILRGVLVEPEILKRVLPADNLSDIKYYSHPLTKIFLELTLNSQAVICCRVAPKQKALVVRMVKKNIKGAITLSVGDGANDVSMILEADVGVGVYGEEGTQAAMSSDYACGEFKCLRKLILFHGRINYMRIAEMILYFFFKNFLFTIPQFYFSFFDAFSAQTLYDDWFLSLFNLIFTANPLLFKALLEQDVNDDDGEFIKKNIPYTYYLGREGVIFNLKTFLLNILLALFESFFVFFFTSYMLNDCTILNVEGFNGDIWANSTTQFTSIILIVNFRLLVSQRYHTIINALIIIITSYLSYVIYLFGSSYFSFSNAQGTIYALITFPHFYLVIFITTSLPLLWDIGVNFVLINYFDEPSTLLRRFLVEYDSTKDKDKLVETISGKILKYDDQVRNLYKVERVPLPNLLTNKADANISIN